MDIQLSALWNKFKERFNLDINQPQPIFLNQSVQPVTVIDDLILNDVEFEIASASMTTTGYRLVTTVPDDEEWTLYSGTMLKSTGTWTMRDIVVSDGQNVYIRIATEALATVLSTGPLSGYVIPAGARIYCYVDSLTVAGVCKFMYTVRKREL